VTDVKPCKLVFAPSAQIDLIFEDCEPVLQPEDLLLFNSLAKDGKYSLEDVFIWNFFCREAFDIASNPNQDRSIYCKELGLKVELQDSTVKFLPLFTMQKEDFNSLVEKWSFWLRRFPNQLEFDVANCGDMLSHGKLHVQKVVYSCQATAQFAEKILQWNQSQPFVLDEHSLLRLLSPYQIMVSSGLSRATVLDALNF
jgi:hypothetical protein